MVQDVAYQPYCCPSPFTLAVAGNNKGGLPLKVLYCLKPDATRRRVGCILPFVPFVFYWHIVYIIYQLANYFVITKRFGRSTRVGINPAGLPAAYTASARNVP